MVRRRGLEPRSPAFKAGRRDNRYTTGEHTVEADEIAQLSLITSLRSRGSHTRHGESDFTNSDLNITL